MENITTNTRSTVIKTSPYPASLLFVIDGDFGGGTATLQWSEEKGAGARWSTVKGAGDADIARTANSNGVVSVGRVGYLSVVLAGATDPDLYFSLIAR